LSGNLMTENDQGEEVLSWHGLTGTATINALSINIPDFALTNNGPMVVEVRSSELVFHDTLLTGNQTNVTLGGSIATSPGGRNTLAINGRVNLRILNLQSPDIISSGAAVLNVMVGGTYEKNACHRTSIGNGRFGFNLSRRSTRGAFQFERGRPF
jgi:hypothetical protein